ncbi:MAG: heparinase II/III family protein [Actinobacteria bacterium]|nr:heparinase II/III family protein [Actinomycetota bacterium]
MRSKRIGAVLLAGTMLSATVGTTAAGAVVAPTTTSSSALPTLTSPTLTSVPAAGGSNRIPTSQRCAEALTPLETLRADSWFSFPGDLRLLGETRPVDLNTFRWESGPFIDPSRVLWYESLMWLAWGAALAAEEGRTADVEAAKTAALRVLAETPDPGSATEQAQFFANLTGWDAAPTYRRLEALNCLADTIGVEPLRPYLISHAEALLDPHRYLGPPQRKVQNLGMLSNLVLLDVGRRLGIQRYQDTALQRLNSEAGQVFTAKGMTLEGSSHYHKVLVTGWEQASAFLKRNGHAATAAQLDRSIAAAYDAGAHFISPTGQPLLIGNSRPEDGFLTPPASNRSLTFQDEEAGFASGRWSWTDGMTSHWTALNSHSSNGHAHDDSLAVTWQTRGLPILVDPGQPDYQKRDNPVTNWSRIGRAHNLAMPAAKAQDREDIRETTVERTGRIDHVSMLSTAHGRPQRRDVIVDDQRATMLVSDHTRKGQTQFWHFDPAWSVTSATANSAILTHTGGMQVEVTTSGALSHVKGSLAPVKGLHTVAFEQMVPAVELTIEGGTRIDTQFRVMPTAKPDTPDISKLSTAAKKSVSLQLSEKQKGAKYLVQSTGDNGNWETLSTFTRFKKQRLPVGGLTNGQEREYRVAAYSKVGISDFSKPVALIPFTRPKRIGVPTVKPKGTQKVLVRWEAPAFDGGRPVTNYLVSTSRKGQTTPVKRNKYVLAHQNLKQLTLYVQAVNEAGPGKRKKITLIRNPKRNTVSIG